MARQSVLFVCLHGAAKSVVAAELLGRMAAERGVDVVVDAAGVEPDAEIPPPVVAALLEEGIDIRGRKPVAVSAEALSAASHVVSFGCDLGDMVGPATPVTLWHDVPAVSDGFAVARAASAARLTDLLERLTPGSPGRAE